VKAALPRIDRRRFLVGATATAGFGSLLELNACTSGGGFRAIPPPGGYTLQVGYTTTTFPGGYTLRTRTYNGSTAGPTLQATPGSPLLINIVNTLPPNPPATVPTGVVHIPEAHGMGRMNMGVRSRAVSASGINPMDNPHLFNTTNLHVHGIQTTPHLFQPFGTSDPNSMMIGIDPGTSYSYNFPVPSDHPSGLFWYHPHHHGSTDVQVSGGMAGLIVMRGAIDAVPEIAAAREILMAIQTIQVNPSTANPGTYDYEPVAYQPPPPVGNGYTLGPAFAFVTVNGQLVSVNNGIANTWTPSQPATYSMRPGEVVRLRILNGCNFLILPLSLPGFDVFAIGYDGIKLLAAEQMTQAPLGTTNSAATMTSGNNVLRSPGGRAELLVRAPQTPGNYTLAALATSDVSFAPFPQIALATFAVGGSPVTMGIPTALPTPIREYPLIADSEIVVRRALTFSESAPSTTILTGVDFLVNNQLYDEMRIDQTTRVGTAEEWTLLNTSTEAHPFHIHVNSFQVVSINGVPLATPRFVDTVLIPPNGKVVFRMRLKQFVGKSVYHCHILPHEDTGMMGNFLITS
jgi:suppressor of ftsI